jgi:hypothetical protein
MVKTVAILAFIGAAGAGAVGLAMKKTVISGKVMAADLLGQLEKKGITEVVCDPDIPIGSDGAIFTCKVHASDGSSASIEYTMSRAGALSAKLLDGTGPTRERVPSTSDPWSN